MSTNKYLVKVHIQAHRQEINSSLNFTILCSIKLYVLKIQFSYFFLITDKVHIQHEIVQPLAHFIKSSDAQIIAKVTSINQ